MKNLFNNFKDRFKTSGFWLRFFTGVCLGCAFPPINLYPLVFVGMVLLIKQITESKGYNEVLRKSYAIIFWFNVVAMSWLMLSGFRMNAERFLIFAGFLTLLAHPLFFWLPIATFYKIFKTFNRLNSEYKYLYLIFLPFIWVSFEYLHSITEFSFPWLSLGNTQTYNLSKIQFIELTGVQGLTFWICALAALIFYLYSKLKSDWIIQSKKSVILIFSILLLYFAPDIYTLAKGSKASYENAFTNGEINVGVIQPNSNPWERWGSKQIEFADEYAEMIRDMKKNNPQVQLIVMHETAITYRILSSPYKAKYEMFRNLIDSINTPLLIGLPYEKIYRDSIEAPPDAKKSVLSNLYFDTFNAAALFEKNKSQNELQIYKKNKLVMGGERVPYQRQLAFLKDFVSWGVGISQWQIGKDTINFELENGVKFNSAICYESVYPGYFSTFVKKGADFCTIITNDGWWGKLFGTYQHNQYATMRAVENRRWIVRCANTGISCFIDPYGKMYNETEINEKASFAGKIGLMKEKTFYTEHGDWLCIMCLWISGAALLVCIVIGFKIKKPSR